jgi:hypothetical protein
MMVPSAGKVLRDIKESLWLRWRGKYLFTCHRGFCPDARNVRQSSPVILVYRC